MANARRPSERTAKNKSAAGNDLGDDLRALARRNPRTRAIDTGPIKIAKSLRIKS